MSSQSERWLRVAAADLVDDTPLLVESGSHAIVLARVGGEFRAVDNACPHAGNPLSEGEILGETLVCAFHGWRFDLVTGSCLHGDAPVRSYSVTERESELWIDLGPRS